MPGPTEIVHPVQPARQVNLFMGAKPVGAEPLILGAAVDREGPPGVIETHHVLGLDIIHATGVNPLGHRRTE